jgi:hypothetical protein
MIQALNNLHDPSPNQAACKLYVSHINITKKMNLLQK